MKTLTKAIATVSFCLIASAPVFAGHGHANDRLFDRLERQHERIEDGIESRALTRKEAKILKKQQRRIRQLVRVYREDGRLSKRERRILRNKLDKASLKIKQFKHNEWTRHTRRQQHNGYCCDHDDLVKGRVEKYRTRHAW